MFGGFFFKHVDDLVYHISFTIRLAAEKTTKGNRRVIVRNLISWCFT